MMMMMMMRLLILLLWALVARGQEEEEVITFEAIVDTEGTRVAFAYDANTQDLDKTIFDWCAANVDSSLAAECKVVLQEQVALAQRERAMVDVALDVKIADGRTERFEHKQGRDLRKEAATFCKEHVPAEGVAACAQTLAAAAMEKANKAETMWGDLFGLTALRGGAYLGTGVFDGDSVKVDDALKNKKFIGTLFAADWCKPCRDFVPKLAEYYRRIAKRRNFEIVWVSGARDKRGFDAMLATMPWLAMSFDPQRSQAIQSAFQVQGFPTFLIFDSRGNLITQDGVQKVIKDPYGFTFPYRTPAQQLQRFARFIKGIITFPFQRRGGSAGKKK